VRRADYLIIGGGVVGLSIGISLLKSRPGLKIFIVEKETKVGLHASSRNSGVLHAGFYYSPDSLKAKFCRQGNEEVKKILKFNGFPVNHIGKLILAKSSEEVKELEVLLARGHANGVDLEMRDVGELKSFEPLASTHEKFLWSPNTAVTDPAFLTQVLLNDFLNLGGKVEYSSKVDLLDSGGEIRLQQGLFDAKFLINAAGNNALKLAKQIGVGTEFSSLPFRGTYWIAKESHFKLSKLIYPVPHKVNPFLGVHFTNTLNGYLKVGPTALPVFGPESYNSPFRANFAEAQESLIGWKNLALGETHSLRSLIGSEAKRIFLKNVLKEASILVPEVRNISKWEKKNSGIRAQIVSNENGELLQDFTVRKKSNSVHILNVVSPGWTSAIPFSKWIIDKFVS
jgi:L-2-hydroxyglutarate oxidase LhgO